MAAPAAYVKLAAEAAGAVCARLSQLFGVEAPVLPTVSRHGYEHLSMLRWKTLQAWVDSLSDEVEIDLHVTVDPDGGLTFATPPTGGTSDETGHIITPIELLPSIVYDPMDETATDDEDDSEVEVSEWLNMSRKALLAAVAERGLDVVGTGANGYVQREDIIEALEHAALNG